MTWLYLPPEPSTPSASAPGSEASNSDCNSLTTISERLCEASCTSRGKLLPSPAWSRRWKRGGYILRLSGLTLEPSTADSFADAWISSLRATRAKATALPESAAANSTTAGCSIAPSTSSIKAGLQLSSARTSRGTLTGNSPSLSRHWSDWAVALRSEYSARPKPAIRCAANDSSSWPGATAVNRPRSPETMAKCAEFRKRNANQDTVPLYLEEVAIMATDSMWPSARTSDTNGPGLHGDGGMDLRTAAVNWASPKASDPEKAGPNMRGSKGDIPLPAQAMHWLAPLVADAGEKITLASHQGSLLKQANDFHPPSSPDQPIIAAGTTSSTDSPNSNQPSVKRKLNPIFVEALMRWPTGLSGFVRPEMAWTLWLQQQLTFVSMLCSQPEQAQMEMF